MSQTLSGLFPVGAFIGRERGKAQTGKITEKIGKVPKRTKKRQKRKDEPVCVLICDFVPVRKRTCEILCFVESLLCNSY